MTKKRWRHIGEGYYQLDEAYCYPGTSLYIVPVKGGGCFIRLVNNLDSPQTEQEVSRQPGTAHSKKTWKNVSGAKRAERWSRNRDWLKKAGITFKEETNEQE